MPCLNLSSLRKSRAQYNYSPLPERYIRLLYVSSNPVCTTYTLKAVKLRDAGSYTALSYVWGSSERTHSIICDGKTLQVTRSVFELLTSDHAKSNKDWPYWIDAICINQNDNEEKADQIRKMHQIFTSAEKVTVWLGQTDQNSDLAMDKLLALSFCSRDLEAYENGRELTSDSQGLGYLRGLNGDEQEKIARALGSLCCRPWFLRVWTFQEIILAGRRAFLTCGSRSMRWYEFAEATRFVARATVHGFSFVFENASVGMHSVESIQEMLLLSRLRERERNGLHLPQLLGVASRKSTTNPLDRVYGVLGLAPPALRSRIRINYGDESEAAKQQLNIECLKACIKHDPELSLLYMVSGSEPQAGLPSWCPNLYSGKLRTLAMGLQGRAGISSRSVVNGQLPKASCQANSNLLRAHGYNLDTVGTVARTTYHWSDFAQNLEKPTVDDAKGNLAWLQEVSALLKQHEHTDIPVSTILTLAEGDLPAFKDVSLQEALKHNIEIWQHSIDPDHPVPQIEERVRTAAFVLHSRFLTNCHHRKVRFVRAKVH
ncbi:uncharacterized protein KY384_009230 [Bacidia gigantensis]|uniref:uncharacterized protein n=1 Tax=Bacidia gigantensis TaxID=2732470 RepID=UPI001D059518|nr:uncharacterized protein KY384_009230 [Bacidia gigantensis]KAG8525586.1 hypothetical protein KY384_009230 [Bacidia gigantensis]